MPVLISFLNATAGLAAAFCGIIIRNRLLIACGATVAASGSILTHVMCRAMNRSLASVFAGQRHQRADRSGSRRPRPGPRGAAEPERGGGVGRGQATAGRAADPFARALASPAAAQLRHHHPRLRHGPGRCPGRGRATGRQAGRHGQGSRASPSTRWPDACRATCTCCWPRPRSITDMIRRAEGHQCASSPRPIWP